MRRNRQRNRNEKEKTRENLEVSWMELYACGVAAFALMIIGTARAYTAPAISSMQTDYEFFGAFFPIGNNSKNGTAGTTSTPSAAPVTFTSWFAAVGPLGAIFGSLMSGPCLQWMGRQKTLVLLTIPAIAGWFIMGFALNPAMILSGRILVGISAGLVLASANLYVSEVSRPKIRGILGFLPTMTIALGCLVGFGLAWSADWRQLSLYFSSFSLAILGFTLTLPESPTWLLLRRRRSDALNSLRRCRPKDTSSDDLMLELEGIQDTLDSARRLRESSGGQFRFMIAALRQRKVWLPTFISVSLLILQNLVGINAVIFFITLILHDAQPKTPDSSITTHILPAMEGAIIVGAVQFIAYFISLPLIDRLGRRVLLVLSSAFMAVSTGILGIYLYLNDLSASPDRPYATFIANTASWLPLTFICLYITAFSIGFGPVPFILMAEMFPTSVRSYFVSLSSVANLLSTFVVVRAYPDLTVAIGTSVTFWIFGGFSLLSIVLVLRFLPETKGKALSEIETLFSK